jgi:hypothetical protein
MQNKWLEIIRSRRFLRAPGFARRGGAETAVKCHGRPRAAAVEKGRHEPEAALGDERARRGAYHGLQEGASARSSARPARSRRTIRAAGAASAIRISLGHGGLCSQAARAASQVPPPAAR